MALPAAGNSISLQQVNVELGNTGTDAINMGSSAVRTLFDDASGAISMSDGFGKSSELGLTASAASSANLKTLFDNNTAGSWAGSTAKRFTIGASTTMGIITAPASMGGTLIIDLAGAIQGVAGSANGGAGATAMTIQSANITINMASGSSISGGGGGGGQGGTGGQGRFTICQNSNNCGGTGIGSCHQDEDVICQYTTSGGAGGAGGIGQGYGQSAANGSSGAGGGTQAGTGGAGGNGAAFGAAGAAGSAGGNGTYTSGSAGSGGGAAGRAITFSGLSAYTIIGTASGTINGAYT